MEQDENVKPREKGKNTYSVLILLSTFIITMGISFAFFTDTSETTTGVTSGTLTIEQDPEDPIHLEDADGNLIDENNPIVPGETVYVAGTITNTGNIPAKIRVTVEEDPNNSGSWTITVPIPE